jgi:hypothetical protein
VTDEAPGEGGGGVIASPAVSTPFMSSQLPDSHPTLPVTAGDTSGFTDDQPVHDSPLLPGAGSAAVTGIGGGHTHFGTGAS